MDYDVIKEAVAKQQSGDRKLAADNSILGKVMTFNIGEQVYGIEIQYVTEIIGMQHITKVPHVPSYIKGIINVRSKVVPIVDIRTRFGKEEIPYTSRTCIITLNFNETSVGIIVDSVADVEDIHTGDISATPENKNVNTNYFIQYMIRGENDSTKLILDVAKLLDEQEA
ncbi:MAG: chemotaxis protein CheW [Oscillospiraceae bacterium]|nr:chemotaxis protein CheW [Oscillospiraceae bacterium]MCH5205933.1 chemotaxis protein CheW [Oscillospiraceae bacterium]